MAAREIAGHRGQALILETDALDDKRVVLTVKARDGFIDSHVSVNLYQLIGLLRELAPRPATGA